MILEFTVENFKSFKEGEFFSMDVKGKYKPEKSEHIHRINGFEILPSAVIYGANASGKSNFIEALSIFRSFIVNARFNTPKTLIQQYQPFLFDDFNSNQPISFELVFLIENVKHRYELSFSEKEVLGEKLFYYPNYKSTLLFDRKKQDYKWGEQLKGEKKTVSKLTGRNQPFLSKGMENNMPQLANVYDFFLNNLNIYSLISDNQIASYTSLIAARLYKNKDSKFYKNFILLLKNLDTGIFNIDIEKTSKKILTNYTEINQFKIYTQHFFKNGDDTSNFKNIPLELESTGTQILFVIIGLILDVLEKGKIIVIDEFERSLHPQMSKFLLSLFNNPQINTNAAQLIVATHDTDLITKDNHLLKDQIWFVEKDDEGVSQLFSLADIKGVDKDAPFDKWYLTGRLGGVPTIKKFTFEQNYKPTLKNGEERKKKTTVSE